MSSTTQISPTLANLSNDLAGAVTVAARFTVAVDASTRYDASGIVWRPGIIVTTAHTVESDDEIAVTTPDGTTLQASLIGRDPTTDIAALRVELDAAAATPAEVSELQVGTLAVAVGRESERGISASLGIVSALGGPWRTWRGGHVDRFIRPDVSLYPGFSGGPLVDARGAVIGMNTAGLSRRVGVTIPAATINRVVDALQRGGRIPRGYLGVGMQPIRLPQALQQSLGLASSGGVILVAVEPDSPADRAGMLLGDVILGLDGVRVDDVEDVQAVLGPQHVGKPVAARVLRGGQDITVTITVGERPQGEE